MKETSRERKSVTYRARQLLLEIQAPILRVHSVVVMMIARRGHDSDAGDGKGRVFEVGFLGRG